ncbi:MAG: TatD family hydrolase [Bacteroidales bacterium]|jgi:TatD DNase family protein|nr:TatD family hydrolase [Bacteroidales bacterium]
MIDTHAHLFLDDYNGDLSAVIERAKSVGVEKVLMPNIDVSSIDLMHSTEDRYPAYCCSMMGLHPTSVDAGYASQLRQMEQWLHKRTYCAIGEIGIDLYWDATHLHEQISAFEEQLIWAKTLHLPVAIHVRKSWPYVLESLVKIGVDGLKGVFHAFSGSGTHEILKMKTFKLGIGGVVTFRNASLRDTLRSVPLEFIVLETDAPFLTPAPYRGKRNEPAYLEYIATELSTVYQLPVDEIKQETARQTRELFQL